MTKKGVKARSPHAALMGLVLNVEYQLKLKTQRNPYKPHRTFSFRINALKRVFHIEFLECV